MSVKKKAGPGRTYIAVKHGVILSQGSQDAGLFLSVSLDDKGSITRGSAVLLALALNEATHARGVIRSWRPGSVDLVAGTSKVVVRVNKRDFVLVGTSADVQGFAPDCPVGVGVLVAVRGGD